MRFTSKLSADETRDIAAKWERQFTQERLGPEKSEILTSMFNYAFGKNDSIVSFSRFWYGKDARQGRFDIINALINNRTLPEIQFFDLLIEKLSNIPDKENSTFKIKFLPVAAKKRNELVQLEEKHAASEEIARQRDLSTKSIKKPSNIASIAGVVTSLLIVPAYSLFIDVSILRQPNNTNPFSTTELLVIGVSCVCFLYCISSLAGLNNPQEEANTKFPRSLEMTKANWAFASTEEKQFYLASKF